MRCDTGVPVAKAGAPDGNEEDVGYMDMLKFMAGIVAVLLCVVVATLVFWFCLFGANRQTHPGGTLVNQAWEVAL